MQPGVADCGFKKQRNKKAKNTLIEYFCFFVSQFYALSASSADKNPKN